MSRVAKAAHIRSSPTTPAATGTARSVCFQSEKPNLTANDPHSVPVELSHNETIEVFVVGAAIVPQKRKCLLLADEEAADAVGAVMDPRGVAAQGDVVGQLVDLVAEGEIGAPPRLQCRTVCRGFDRMRQNVIRVEEGFEDRGAGAR